MMVTAFVAAGGPWLSQMGRVLADLPGALQEKVKRMSRFLCRSEFDLSEAFASLGRRIIETVAHAHPKRMIEVALDWTDLGEFMGLWLSLPYHGRALPLWCAVLPKEKALGSMTGEEQELLDRLQKNTAWGKLSIYSIARACFDLCLQEAPAETAQTLVDRWSNRHAA